MKTYIFTVPDDKQKEFENQVFTALLVEGVEMTTPEAERQRIMEMPLADLEKDIVY